MSQAGMERALLTPVPPMNMATFLEWNKTIPLAQRYLIASCIVMVAFAIRYLALPLDSGNQLGIFYPAVALSFLIGGTGPGILATLASTLLSAFFFPDGAFAFNSDTIIPLGLFALTSVAFGYVISSMRDFRMKSIAFDQSLLGALSTAGEGMLTLATQGANIGFWRWNILEDTVLLSDICCDYYGLPHQTRSISYEEFVSHIFPDDRDWVLRAREATFVTHKDFKAEFRCIWPDGTIHWVSSIGRPHFTADGILDRMDFVMLDIAPRKQLEHRITELDLGMAKEVRARTDYLLKANDALTTLSELDVLTGLPNRRRIDQQIRSAYARLKRYQEGHAVLMLDIDFFKRVNDAYGHQVGDEVLQLLSQTLRKNLRETDFVGRYGGEEFLILLPSTDLDHATRAAEKLRAAVEATPHPQAGAVTVSIGVAVASPDQENEFAATIEADKQLYAAKQAGRNRVSAKTALQVTQKGDAA